MKRDNLLGSLWLIYNTMPDVMVSFVAKNWQFNSEPQSTQKDVSDSGWSSFASWMFQTAKTSPFIVTHGQVCSKKWGEKTKVALKSFPCTESSHPVSLFPHWMDRMQQEEQEWKRTNRPNVLAGRLERERRQGQLDAQILFFVFRKEWMINYWNPKGNKCG